MPFDSLVPAGRYPSMECTAEALVWYAVIRHMKRTTIFIPETLERDLQLYARRAGRPVASVVREAVAQYLTHAGRSTALPSFASIAASGRTDVAERHEALLFRNLEPHDDAVRAKRVVYRRGQRPKR
jgi:hypothetical protein